MGNHNSESIPAVVAIPSAITGAALGFFMSILWSPLVAAGVSLGGLLGIHIYWRWRRKRLSAKEGR